MASQSFVYINAVNSMVLDFDMTLSINTNTKSMFANLALKKNSTSLQRSLGKLSSGLRINTTADDASGMVIADSLKSQKMGLEQAVRNASDGISIIQTADGALQESMNILNTIKIKSVQAASDGQTRETRQVIQADINKLLEEFDTISKTTSFNGQKLLSGMFSNKHFQVGASSGETIGVSINSAESTKIGHITSSTISPENVGYFQFTTKDIATGNQFTTNTVNIQYNNQPKNGLGALADEINQSSESTNIKAVAVVESYSTITSGQTGNDFQINGIPIGNVNTQNNDSDGSLVNSINNKKLETGVIASTGGDGKLVLESVDGRSIKVEGLAPPTVVDSTSLTTLGSLKMIKRGFNNFQIDEVRAPNTLYTSEIPNNPNILFNPETKHFYENVFVPTISGV